MRLGVFIACAAQLALAPRMIVFLCELEGIDLAAVWTLENWLFVISSVGLSLSLTGGSALLAHQLAKASRWQGWVSLVGTLTLTAAILLPDVRASLTGEELKEAVGNIANFDLPNLWASIFILAPEFCAVSLVYACGLEVGDEVKTMAAELEEANEQIVAVTSARNQAEHRAKIAEINSSAECNTSCNSSASDPRSSLRTTSRSISRSSAARMPRNTSRTAPELVREVLQDGGEADVDALVAATNLKRATVVSALRRMSDIQSRKPQGSRRMLYSLQGARA